LVLRQPLTYITSAIVGDECAIKEIQIIHL
jgi:hypothetical protein